VGTATGANFLLEADGKRIVVDCGFLQGVENSESFNSKPFAYDPLSVDAVIITHAHADHHEHHHETFWSKYVFSMDHKMIAKQFLITGIVMAVIGMVLSVLFRIQLGWPDEQFPFLERILGKWAKDCRLYPSSYMSMVTIHGTIMVFFVLTAGLSGTFSNLLIPLQV